MAARKQPRNLLPAEGPEALTRKVNYGRYGRAGRDYVPPENLTDEQIQGLRRQAAQALAQLELFCLPRP